MQKEYNRPTTHINADIARPHVKYAIFALAASILLTASLLTLQPQWLPQEKTYHAQTTTRTVGEARVIQLIFHPQTSEHDIRMFLQDSEGELLGSPSAKGVYRVAVNNLLNPQRYVIKLREHPAIMWADLEH